jgi:tetratricopeptide (TPR) repeat protein
MNSNDPRSVDLRIAKLRERLREKPKTRFEFLKDSSKIISISAFIISVVTTVYSWRKDDLRAHEVARRQFDSTMQQMVDTAFKNFEFTEKHKTEPSFGQLAGWFNAQQGLMGNKVVQDLASVHDASMLDYIMVGYNLVSLGQNSRAATLFERAIEIGHQRKKEHDQIVFKVIRTIETKLFGEKIDLSLSDEQRAHDLVSAYTSLGLSLLNQSKTEDARKAYEAAIQVTTESTLIEPTKRYYLSFIHKNWAEAILMIDCKLALSHLQTAAEYMPEAKKIPEDVDWRSIQNELSWGSAHCDGKLHGDGPPANLAEDHPQNSPSPGPAWPTPNSATAAGDLPTSQLPSKAP